MGVLVRNWRVTAGLLLTLALIAQIKPMLDSWRTLTSWAWGWRFLWFPMMNIFAVAAALFTLAALVLVLARMRSGAIVFGAIALGSSIAVAIVDLIGGLYSVTNYQVSFWRVLESVFKGDVLGLSPVASPFNGGLAWVFRPYWFASRGLLWILLGLALLVLIQAAKHLAQPTSEAAAPHKSAKEPSGLKLAGIALASVLVVSVVAGGIALAVGSSAASTANGTQNARASVSKSVISDVTNESLAMESYYATNNSYPTTKQQATSASNPDKIIVSSGNTLVFSTDGSMGYCIEGSNPKSDYSRSRPKVYDSAKGGLQVDGATCSVTYPNTFVIP